MVEARLEKKIIAVLTAALAITGTAGAFAISLERQRKVEIANAVRLNELEISRLRRDNEELSVKIARQESPSILSIRAGRMGQPSEKGVVWAYENFDGGRVEFRENGVLSFRTPEETAQ